MSEDTQDTGICVDCGKAFTKNHPEDEICLPCWNGSVGSTIQALTEWLEAKEQRDAQI